MAVIGGPSLWWLENYKSDPLFNQTVLYLNGNGINGANNNVFTDSSVNNFAITRNGNATQGTFSPFSAPEGYWSNYFDGTGDYLSVPNNSNFQLGSGDFTIEAWVYPTVVPSTIGVAGNIISLYDSSNNNRSWALQLFQVLSSSTTECSVRFGVSTDGTVTNLTNFTGGTITPNSWFHIAAVRSGSTITVYVNGVSVASGSYASTLFNTSVNLTIGRFANDAATFPGGYISNARVVKGTAVYTGNFTPSGAPLTPITNTSLLTCQSNRFKDNSTNNFTLTRNGDVRVTYFSPFNTGVAYDASINGASGYFDGASDYLAVSNNTILQLPSEDFTIEAWLYLKSLPISGDSDDISIKGATTNSNLEYGLRINNTSGTYTLRLTYANSGSGGTSNLRDSSSISPSLLLNTWCHVAMTRIGTTVTFWVNGQQYGTGVIASTINTGTGNLNIGINGGATGNHLDGYISNFRILKGTALYTSNFTPPTAPLTAIANTSLLLNSTNSGIFDSTGKNVLETVGNAQVSTSVTKFGTGSMSFDGNGDALIFPSTDALGFGTGDLTVEFWFRLNTLSQGNRSIGSMFEMRTGSIIQEKIALMFNASPSNNIDFYFNNGVRLQSSSVAIDTWYHLALTRESGVWRMFINGTSVGSTYTSAADLGLTNILRIGQANAGDGNNDFLNGYIDDLRVTKGVARYTSNFIPPLYPYPRF